MNPLPQKIACTAMLGALLLALSACGGASPDSESTSKVQREQLGIVGPNAASAIPYTASYSLEVLAESDPAVQFRNDSMMGINDDATVAASSKPADISYAYRFTRNGSTALSRYAKANAVNASGMVVGQYQDSFGGPRVVLWGQDGGAIEIDDRVKPFSTGNALNAQGWVVGTTSSEMYWKNARATVFNPRKGSTYLDPIGGEITDGSYSAATGINDSFQVVGNSYILNKGSYRATATLWDYASGMTTGVALPRPNELGGDTAVAAINNTGLAVGTARSSDGLTQVGLRWNIANSTVTMLDSLTHADLPQVDKLFCEPKAVHDNGDAVGGCSGLSGGANGVQVSTAVVWRAGTTSIQKVDPLLGTAAKAAGWQIWRAYGVNASGQIVAEARRSSDPSHFYVVRLTPQK